MTAALPDTDVFDRLAARLGVTAAALAAVAEVESSGRGFLPVPARSPGGLDVSGYPVIRFEAHIFWKELKKVGIDPFGVDPPRPDLLSSSMNLKLVKSVAGDWDRLTAARSIHEAAADRSASWGRFQIMGFNAELCGVKDVWEFVRQMHDEDGQTELFAGFISGQPGMKKALKNRDWKSFARLYNGKLYFTTGYDRKIREAYERQVKNRVA
jgi:hypothetical protein